MNHFTQLVGELRRRHVFRVAVAYVVAAWVVLQVADLAFESLELPGQALGHVWLALFVGFPVALVFGWRYDITADGVVRTPPTDAGQTVDLSLRRPDFMILGTLAVVVAAIVLHELGRGAESEAAFSELRERFGTDAPNVVAEVYAWKGDADTAFAWLDKVVDLSVHPVRMEFQSPLLSSLHDDPRWEAFLEPWGLTPEQLAAIPLEVTLPPGHGTTGP